MPGDYARRLCQAFLPGQMALINGLTIGQILSQVKVFPNPAILLGKIKFDFSKMGVILVYYDQPSYYDQPKPS